MWARKNHGKHESCMLLLYTSATLHLVPVTLHEQRKRRGVGRALIIRAGRPGTSDTQAVIQALLQHMMHLVLW